MNLPTTALLISSLFMATTSPIVMRHDVDEAGYLRLAEEYGGSFVRLNVGCGTFIRSTWILTAAHVASSSRVGNSVTVDGVAYAIKRKIIHPGFGMENAVLKDIALIELEQPVVGVEPAVLYGGSDEVGKEIVFVGTGWAGTGDKGMADGAITKDRRLRAANNLIDGAKPDYLRFTFDEPGSDGALPLEGISGPGDSGGPALWGDGGQTFILGVSSHQDGRGREPEGVYGVYEYYTRVSEFHDWILQELGEK